MRLGRGSRSDLEAWRQFHLVLHPVHRDGDGRVRQVADLDVVGAAFHCDLVASCHLERRPLIRGCDRAAICLMRPAFAHGPGSVAAFVCCAGACHA